MKRVCKMLMAALLSLALLLPLLGAAAEDSATVYGVCTADSVRVRKQAATSAKIWFYIDEGFVAEILNEIKGSDGNVIWYKINSTHPVPNGRTYIGYVSADYFRPLTEQETEDYLKGLGVTLPTATPTAESTEEPTATPAPEATATPSADDSGYTGKDVIGASGTVIGATNFRSKPSTTTGSILATIPAWTKVEITGVPAGDAEEPWYRVVYKDQIGYVHGGMLRVDDAGVTPTPAPGFGTEVTDTTGVVTADGVRLRTGPSTSANILRKLDEGTEVEILTIPDQIGAAYWYRVRHNGDVGYIQSNYIRVNKDDDSTDEPTAAPGDEEDDVLVTATGMITADGVNFRVGPGQQYNYIGKLNSGTVVELLTIPSVIDENHWYCVRYNGQEGYIQSNYIRVLTVDESYLPNVQVYGYAKLVKASTYLRTEPAGSYDLLWKGVGNMLRITGDPVQKKGYNWYPVYNEANATIYYVRGDMIEIVYLESGEVVTPTPAPESAYGYVITTDYDVHLRIQPAGEVITQVPINTILACVGKSVSPQESGTSYTWYYVQYQGMYGYLRGDCVRVCSSTGGDITGDPTPEPEETTPSVTIYGYIRLTDSGVNLRATPAGDSQVQLPKDLILPVIADIVPEGEYGKYCWYKVCTADGMVGYIRGDFAVQCDAQGNEISPDPTPTPTPAEPDLTGATGKILKNTNFRDYPSTSEDLSNILTVIKAGTIVDVLTIPENRYSGWYKISYNGTTGYVYASLLQLIDDGSTPTPAPTATPTPSLDETESSYVMITHNKVNIREGASMDSNKVDQVNKGTVMPYVGYKMVGSTKWYNIVYQDVEVWVHSGYAKIMTMAEYLNWLASNPDAEPDVTANLGYLKLTADKVYIRNAANGSKIIDQLAEGTVIRYYTNEIFEGGYNWFRILTPDGEFGYIRADMVEKCDQYGEALPTATPSIGSTSSAPDSQQETSYSTLKLGSTGEKVTNLVNELINQGYYSGTVTSTFTSAVQTAVKAFQSANGLTVDGIAGSLTQHKLFGTQPVGSGDTSNLEFTIYPVEKIDWFTGGIQQMIPRGANFKVYDVKTGIVWWAHRWAGSYHADIETLTAADTARLCQIYGVDDAQEIYDKNLWQRRPCLVTIGTRTFACSLDGMPHNPDGDTIANNNMTGQICLHFTNSTGHESGVVSTSHAEAIEYAYNNCPAGQKK